LYTKGKRHARHLYIYTDNNFLSVNSKLENLSHLCGDHASAFDLIQVNFDSLKAELMKQKDVSSDHVAVLQSNIHLREQLDSQNQVCHELTKQGAELRQSEEKLMIIAANQL
jgi:hypothetical protein